MAFHPLRSCSSGPVAACLARRSRRRHGCERVPSLTMIDRSIGRLEGDSFEYLIELSFVDHVVDQRKRLSSPEGARSLATTDKCQSAVNQSARRERDNPNGIHWRVT